MSAEKTFPADFVPADEAELGERFLHDGYLLRPAEDRLALDRIRDHVAAAAARALAVPDPGPPQAFLDNIHQRVSPCQLNALRLEVIEALNAEPWLRPACLATARRAVEAVVGNELAMQRRVNLSIQLPHDDSSLLPVHADVWSGDSPFEVVLWIPLVDCRATKSMYLLPPEPNAALEKRFADFHSAEAVYRAIEPDLLWLDAPYGHTLLFNQNLAHGNRVNIESETRWSLNCRFKGVFTPYAGKRLGEFFEPVTLRPASRIGLAYELPGGFHE